MPSRSHPPGMPAEVRSVIHVLGSEVRTEILRVVAQGGELSTADVARRAGASESAALRHLKALHGEGLVELVESTGLGRAGVRLTWRPNVEKVDELAQAWARYARGE